MPNSTGSQRYLGLGPLEYQVITVMWDRGAWVTVGDVLAVLNVDARRQHAYSTIKTILGKLLDKGHLRKRVNGKAHEYEAVQCRADAERQAVRGIVRPLLSPGNPLMAHLVDELASDERALNNFERLLAARRGRRQP